MYHCARSDVCNSATCSVVVCVELVRPLTLVVIVKVKWEQISTLHHLHILLGGGDPTTPTKRALRCHRGTRHSSTAPRYHTEHTKNRKPSGKSPIAHLSHDSAAAEAEMRSVCQRQRFVCKIESAEYVARVNVSTISRFLINNCILIVFAPTKTYYANYYGNMLRKMHARLSSHTAYDEVSIINRTGPWNFTRSVG